MNALHCVSLQGTTFTHHRSEDGGLTWDTMNHSLDGVASSIEEWEFQASAGQDLFVLNVRYQDAAGPDVDMLWHVRGVSESLEADTLTYLGQGDLDRPRARATTSASISPASASCPTGVVVAYHDSTHEDPLFAVELDLPA